MKKEIYHHGKPGQKYGIWNTAHKCWQFNVCEDTPMLAVARLYQKIGCDARKNCFEPRLLPAKMRREVMAARPRLQEDGYAD